jgi:hypothetical protein
MEAWRRRGGSKWRRGGSVGKWSQTCITLIRSRIRIRIQTRIEVKSLICIRIKVRSWTRIRIKVMRIRNRNPCLKVYFLYNLFCFPRGPLTSKYSSYAFIVFFLCSMRYFKFSSFLLYRVCQCYWPVPLFNFSSKHHFFVARP